MNEKQAARIWHECLTDEWETFETLLPRIQKLLRVDETEQLAVHTALAMMRAAGYARRGSERGRVGDLWKRGTEPTEVTFAEAFQRDHEQASAKYTEETAWREQDAKRRRDEERRRRFAELALDHWPLIDARLEQWLLALGHTPEQISAAKAQLQNPSALMLEKPSEPTPTRFVTTLPPPIAA